MIDIEDLIYSDPDAQEGIQESEDYFNGYIDLETYDSLDDFKEEIEYEISNGIED